MKVQAYYLGQRLRIAKLLNQLHYKEVKGERTLIMLGKAFYMALFPYGVVVFWGGNEERIEKELKKIEPFIVEKRDDYYSEKANIRISDKAGDRINDKGLFLTTVDEQRIVLVSEILARSLALEFFEKETDHILQQHDEVLISVSQSGKTHFSTKTLLKKVSNSMRIQHLCMGQMAMLDKPDLTWESSELDRFYNVLKAEYEISERYIVLNQKLQGLVQSSEFILNYLESKRSNFLEFVIVVLIVLEIALAMFGVLT